MFPFTFGGLKARFTACQMVEKQEKNGNNLVARTLFHATDVRTYDDATRVCHRYIEAARAIADARRCRGAYLRILLNSALYMYRIEVVAWRRRRRRTGCGGGWEFESTG